MTKKHFIALANKIILNNIEAKNGIPGAVRFDKVHIRELADFCETQNPKFDRQLWLDYIAGNCGPNGGKL